MGAARADGVVWRRGRIGGCLCVVLATAVLAAPTAAQAGPCANPNRGNTTAGDDLIVGGPGADRLFGGGGVDRIHGCGGDDEIYGGGRGDFIYGGGGNDRLFGQLLDDRLYGGRGQDLLVGSHGSDQMRGRTGNDWLRGGTGGDDYFGGRDHDVTSFIGARPSAGGPAGSGVQVNLTAHSASGEGGDTVRGIESVLGSAFDDTLVGNNAPGGAVAGGPGNDSCSQFTAPDASCGDGGPARPYVSLETWRPAGFPVLDPALLVVGGPLPTVAQAGPSDPTVTVSPQGGFHVTPTLTRFSAVPPCTDDGSGGVSCPRGSIDPGGVAMVWGGEGGQTLTVADGFGQSLTFEVDGGPGDDTLNGGSSDENLYGADGADLVHGHGGDDALISEGSGPDTLFGDNGTDQLVTSAPCQGHTFHGGPGGDDIAGFARTVAAGINATLGGTAFLRQGPPCATPTHLVDAGDNSQNQGDVLEVLEGTNADDILVGNARANTIWGRRGNDILRGLGGSDLLTGHAGVDSFFGGTGFDHLFARDGQRDAELGCDGDGGRIETRDPNDPAGTGCG
jgi:Ca2+-binding RTX toxin-like protein